MSVHERDILKNVKNSSSHAIKCKSHPLPTPRHQRRCNMSSPSEYITRHISLLYCSSSPFTHHTVRFLIPISCCRLPTKFCCFQNPKACHAKNLSIAAWLWKAIALHWRMLSVCLSEGKGLLFHNYFLWNPGLQYFVINGERNTYDMLLLRMIKSGFSAFLWTHEFVVSASFEIHRPNIGQRTLKIVFFLLSIMMPNSWTYNCVEVSADYAHR